MNNLNNNIFYSSREYSCNEEYSSVHRCQRVEYGVGEVPTKFQYHSATGMRVEYGVGEVSTNFKYHFFSLFFQWFYYEFQQLYSQWQELKDSNIKRVTVKEV